MRLVANSNVPRNSMTLYQRLIHLLELLGRRTRAFYLSGLLVGVCFALSSSAPYMGDGKRLAREDMTAHTDVENLYEASQAASWSDVPRWWAGPWNYPGVGYYRPLTSM